MNREIANNLFIRIAAKCFDISLLKKKSLYCALLLTLQLLSRMFVFMCERIHKGFVEDLAFEIALQALSCIFCSLAPEK